MTSAIAPRPAATAAPRSVPRWFSRSLYRVELLRQLRNAYTLAFTLVTPVAMYLLFGTGLGLGEQRLENGNAAFFIMATIGAFGAATAMSSICSIAASEVRQGWGRQIAMTPLPITGYAVTKLLAALTFAILAVGAVFVAGAATGAEADSAWVWVSTAAIALGGGIVYGLWGMGVGMLLNPDSAAALASIAVAFFAFAGNAFVPLDGAVLDIARFTPMYGYIGLSRWPVSGGELVAGGSDPLWLLVANAAAWTAVFVVLCRAGVTRSRHRR